MATICKYIYKYILIGDSNSGKSSFLQCQMGNKFDANSNHTIGVDFGTDILEINGDKIKRQIWDTAGQERFKTITRAYYRSAVAALLFYDITNRKSFNNVVHWLTDVKSEITPQTVICLIGNKNDLDEKREVNYEEGEKFAKENDLLFFETSAKNNYNVKNVFDISSRKIYDKVSNGILSPFPMENTVLHESLKSKEEKSCVC